MIERRALGPLEFCKYHALGNDYLVVDGGALGAGLTPQTMAALCHRHTGVGGDGVLVLGPGAIAPSRDACTDASLRIFNPDGSEAEKSGNGLRIFGRALHDLGYVQGDVVRVGLGGAVVPMWLMMHKSAASEASARPQVEAIQVAMGRPSFRSLDLAMACPPQDTTRLELDVMGQRFDVTAVSMGNPHCVVFAATHTPELLRQIGPVIERHPLFERRTNMQLVRVVSRHHLELLIWERGAGETSASGSSSCAAVAAAQARGLCDPAHTIKVTSPGGTLFVRREQDGTLTLTGPAEPVCRGHFMPQLVHGQ